MKMRFLMASVLVALSATAFAQKGELNNAQSEFEKYQTLKQVPAMAEASLKNAKTSIDKASVHEKTAALPQTFAVKGAIYAALAERDTVAATSAPLAATAEEALKKAKDADTKGDYKKIISEGYNSLAMQQRSIGAGYFKNKDYASAYKAFETYQRLLPEDTTAMYYTGIAAYNSQNYAGAVNSFGKLVNTKYSDIENVYNDFLIPSYLASKDTAGAIKAISEGVTKYPKSSKLKEKEVLLYITAGRSKDVIEKLQAAIAAEPKRKELYYYAGVAYGQIAEQAMEKVKSSKDAAAKNAAKTTKAENYDKATAMYKKALEIDPNYFDANLNLGYALLSPAIDNFNAANNLPSNATQKQYNDLMAKAGVQFDAALPYVKKAVELQPKNPDALGNLITYYKGKKDDANVAKYSKMLKDAQ